MTPEESEKESYHFYDKIPEMARAKWIAKYLGKSPRTIARYREQLFRNCFFFQRMACEIGIDSPFLCRHQMQLIVEFSELMDRLRFLPMVLAEYHKTHPHPSDDLKEWGFTSDTEDQKKAS